MRRAVPLVIAALAVLPPGAAAAKGSSPYGVAAGEVTPTSAVLWTRFARAGTGRVVVQRAGVRVRDRVATRSVRALAAHDLAVSVRVKGLAPETRYAYRFLERRGGRERSGAEGYFTTAPRPSEDATVEFAFSGDADAQPAAGTTKPFYNDFQVYGRMAAEGNDFNVNFGDTIYSDTEVGSTLAGGAFTPAAPTALTVEAKWAKYRQNLALANLQRLRGTGATYSHWDDHEFVNDFSRPEHGEAVYAAGVRAFRDYAPVTYTARDGLYRTFRWGRNLELFFLDERSFRSAKADDACVNPSSGQPDLGPTAPRSVRSLFGLVVESFRAPVAQACLDALNDPARTFLGARQLARFEAAIRRSTATFKVVMNETPIQQLYALPYDRWEGYAAERRKLIAFLRDKVKNVVFLTTDTHANLVNDVRLQTLEPGGPIDSGMLEVVTGPVATMTFDREVGGATGSPNAGDLLARLFLLVPPPAGVGMKCAALDVYSYAQVRVTGSAITITPKDAKGVPIKGCGPFTVRRR